MAIFDRSADYRCHSILPSWITDSDKPINPCILQIHNKLPILSQASTWPLWLSWGFPYFFLIALTVLMLVFIYKYRKDKHPKAIQNEGSNKLEVLWTVIPLILVLVMFYFGWMGWKPMKNPPDEAMHVKAIARMWNFRFRI